MTAQDTIAQDRFVTVNGLRLHYLDYGGEGRPVLLFLHGLSGHAHTFDMVAPHFVDRYHTLSIDVRGRGESAWSSEGDYRMSAYTSDLGGLQDALGVERISLVGTSMGGAITMTYAGTRPERVERAVLNDIGPEIDPRGLQRIIGYVGGAPESFATMDEATAWFRENYPEMLHRLSDEQLRRWAGYSLREQNGRLAWRMDPAIRRMQAPDAAQVEPWQALRGIRCPLLVLRGKNSDILSEATAKKMVESVPDGRLVEVPGVGHAPTLTEPEAVEALDEFLRG